MFICSQMFILSKNPEIKAILDLTSNSDSNSESESESDEDQTSIA